MTTFRAFSVLGEILQLTCSYPSAPGINIRADCSTIPATILPTSQQLIVPHLIYIDLLPWASLRDRILTNLPAIDEPELYADLVADEPKIWGSTPWDPSGWELGRDFVRIWWFLLDEGILSTSNFWRMQRGECAQAIPQLEGQTLQPVTL